MTPGTDELFRRFDEIRSRRGSQDLAVATRGRAFVLGADAEDIAEEELPLAPEEGLAEVRDQSFQSSEEPHAAPDGPEPDWQVQWLALADEALDLQEPGFLSLRPPLPKPLLRELQEDDEATCTETQRWLDSLWEGLGHVRKRVHVLEQNCQYSAPEQIKALTKSIDRELETYKAQQRQLYESMALQELELEDSLQGLGRRFDGWLQRPSGADVCRDGAAGRKASGRLEGLSGEGGSSGSRSASPTGRAATGAVEEGTEAQEDEEIKQIRITLADMEAEERKAGALTGGWTSMQHNVFMRVFRMFKMQATPTCYAKLAERFPDMQEADIISHVRWVADFQNRQAQKRLLLQRWRHRRLELEQEAADAEKEAKSEEAVKRRQAEEQDYQLRLEQRKKVAEWKQARSEEGERLTAAQQRQSDQEKARRMLEQQNRHNQVREAAEAFRAQRAAEAEQERERHEARSRANRRAVSQEDRQRIAQRNFEALKKKLLVPPAPPSARPAGRPPEPPWRSRAYEHVESRLHEPTEAFTQKLAARAAERDKADVPVARSKSPRARRPASAEPRRPQLAPLPLPAGIVRA